MKLLKTNVSVLMVCSALLLPSAVSAATEVDTANPPTTISPSLPFLSTNQTNVNGIYVTGNYVINKDSRVAFIPGGVGLVVVNKETVLPRGAYYQDTFGAVRHVELTNSKGESVGHAVLIETPVGVSIVANVSGLTAGKHGFHIHQSSIVENDFKTAGDHFNPDQKKHGLDNPDGTHLGDLQNLEVQADGTATLNTMLKGATLVTGKNNSLLGRSLIIHSAEDDGKTDPSGNSGDRIAGGNIKE